MGAMRLDPACHRARHRQGCRYDSAQGNFAKAAPAQRRDRRRCGSLAAATEMFHLAANAFVDEPEGVTSETGHVRIDHRQDGGGRNRRIDRGAAGA